MINIDIQGLDQLTRGFTSLSSDAREIMDDILDSAASVILKGTKKRFLAEQDPTGKKWEQSKSAKIRRAGGYTVSHGKSVTATGTLYATGHLYDSIQLYKKHKARLVGTNADEAETHQLGLFGLPVREFIGRNDQDVEIATAAVNILLNRRLNDAF